MCMCMCMHSPCTVHHNHHQSKIAPPGIVGKGAEELISAEEDAAAQVEVAVGRERTSAC